jgi:hypothetical protein
MVLGNPHLTATLIGNGEPCQGWPILQILVLRVLCAVFVIIGATLVVKPGQFSAHGPVASIRLA